MGTKLNPGKFDCYEKAAPDEPIFILLGRDPHAAEVVGYWIALRIGALKPQGFCSQVSRETYAQLPEKIREALDCCHDLENYSLTIGRKLS